MLKVLLQLIGRFSIYNPYKLASTNYMFISMLSMFTREIKQSISKLISWDVFFMTQYLFDPNIMDCKQFTQLLLPVGQMLNLASNPLIFTIILIDFLILNNFN